MITIRGLIKEEVVIEYQVKETYYIEETIQTLIDNDSDGKILTFPKIDTIIVTITKGEC